MRRSIGTGAICLQKLNATDTVGRMNDPRTLLKDAGYVTVGLGVIAFQRAQVRRRQLEKQLGHLPADFDDIRAMVEERAGALGEQVDRTIVDIRDRLPEQAVAAFETAVGVARDATGQLLDRVRPA